MFGRQVSLTTVNTLAPPDMFPTGGVLAIVVVDAPTTQQMGPPKLFTVGVLFAMAGC